jgi:hypothetical protein
MTAGSPLGFAPERGDLSAGGLGGNSSSGGEPVRDGVDVGAGLRMKDHQLPAVPLGSIVLCSACTLPWW